MNSKTLSLFGMTKKSGPIQPISTDFDLSLHMRDLNEGLREKSPNQAQVQALYLKKINYELE